MTPGRIIIVGAGMTGLTAARQLRERGWHPLILDKGRAIGGRMATRRMEVDGAVMKFDHGAQYFTARDPAFIAAVEEWQRAGVVRIWTDRFPPNTERYSRYCGTMGMAGIASHLAAELSVKSEARVDGLSATNGGWTVRMATGETHEAEAVLLTQPVPQILQLLETSDIALSSPLAEQLRQIEYAPCLAVMAIIDRPSEIPEPGGVMIGPEPLSWIADNTSKGLNASGSAITIHAGPQFSRLHYADDEAEVIARILDAAKKWLGGSVRQAALHRWLYSLAIRTHDEPMAVWHHANGAPLLFAGDGFGGARIEGAYRSGCAVAAYLE